MPRVPEGARIEPQLFAPPPQPRSWAESAELYDAVLYLRKKGVRVLRISGTQSRVGGKLLDNRGLKEIARALGWKEVKK